MFSKRSAGQRRCRGGQIRTSCALVVAAAVVGCGPSTPPPQTAPPQPAAAAGGQTAGPPAEIAPPQATSTGPEYVAISELSPGSELVRVRGTITRVLGMRLVPPKVIFTVNDGTGDVTAVIAEKTTLREGARLELVGTYRRIPSPMHQGPGEGPDELVFVVDRYLQRP